MKIFLTRLFQFSLLAFLLYMILLFLWGSFMPEYMNRNLNYWLGSYGHMHTRMKEAKLTTRVDVLFLGSSTAYRGFDNRIFKKHGIKSFNLGSSAQTPLQTEALLNKYLDQLNPELIIYEVNPEILFENDGVEATLDLISNCDIDPNMVKMALKLNHLKVYNTFFYSLIRKTFTDDKDFLEPVEKYNDTYIEGGYVQKNNSGNLLHEKFKSKEIIVSETQRNHFRFICDLFKKQGLNYVLVFAPVNSDYYNSMINISEIIRLISAEGKFLNFNNDPDFSDFQDFYDHVHLNQHGVEKFNLKLIKTLEKENYFGEANQVIKNLAP